MSKAVKSGDIPERKRMRPALTPEARENQMVSLAVDLAEQQLRDGTASSQVIVHYLKLGSSKEKAEKELMEKRGKLLDAQTKSIASDDQAEKTYKEALRAFKGYAGQDVDDE